MALEFFPLEIASIKPAASDAVVVEFEVPEKLRSEFEFVPGQHLTLRYGHEDGPLRRFYSICSTPHQDKATKRLRIGVREIDAGRVSGYFNKHAKKGDLVEVLPPRGRFRLRDGMAGKHLLALVSGSGITPVYSMLAAHLAADANSTASLVFGNRNTSSIMLRQQLDNLKDQFLDRFQMINILSREQQEFDLLNGRIDGEKIKQIASSGVIDINRADQVLICGPSDMIDNAQSALEGLGVNSDLISFERFTALEKPAKQSWVAASVPDVSGNPQGAHVSFVLDGVNKEFQIGDGEDSVLEGAHKAGVELPFSCAGGMCATCRCKLVEGEVEMRANYSLEQWELDAGYVLACQSLPKTDKIKLDFDAS